MGVRWGVLSADNDPQVHAVFGEMAHIIQDLFPTRPEGTTGARPGGEGAAAAAAAAASEPAPVGAGLLRGLGRFSVLAYAFVCRSCRDRA